MLKKGDKYIHFTKYGGVNFGIVKDIWSITTIDVDNGCSYLKPQLISYNGLSYDIFDDGKFYKVQREFTAKELENIRENNKRIAGMTKHERISEMLKGVKLPHEKADL